MTTEDVVPAWVARRDDICRRLDVEGFLAFVKEMTGSEFKPSHPSVPLAAMHKARLHIQATSEAEKAISRRWLVANGYKPSWKGVPG